MNLSQLTENIQALKQKVKDTALQCGRRPEEIEIVYVTKTVDSQIIQMALEAGAENLGENRVQELLEKKEKLSFVQSWKHFSWHLIGHLQTNKVKQIAGEVDLIHSLDSLELAQALEKQAAVKQIVEIPCLIQVNSSGESSKYGLAPDLVEAFVRNLPGPAVKIKGLMTIGPLTGDRDKIRASFRTVRELRDRLKKVFPGHSWNILSMGMSGDFETAIEEGSTLIRIGTAIFGERKK